MQVVIEFEDGTLGKVTNMYDARGDATLDRLEAEAIVVQLPNGQFMTGSIESYEGLHIIQ